MTSPEQVAGTIRKILKMLSLQFGAVGAWDHWQRDDDKGRFDAFYAKRQLLSQGSDYGEIVIVPRVQGCSTEELLAVLREIRESANDPTAQGLLVDAFSSRSQPVASSGQTVENAKTGDLEIVQPGEFWTRLACISKYRSGLVLQDVDLLRARSEFVSRRLTQVGARSQRGNSQLQLAIPQLVRWARSDAARGLLIAGERGSGKTWILKRFLDELLERNLQDPWSTPAGAYVSLREYASFLRLRQGVRRSLSHYLYEVGGLRPRGGISTLESLVSSGRLILLLDGIDELTRGAPISEFGEQVATLLDYLPAMARVVVTTRGTKFSSPEDMEAQFAVTGQNGDGSTKQELVRSQEDVIHRPAFDLWQLSPFSPKDTETLLKRVTAVDEGPEDDSSVIDTLNEKYGKEAWDRSSVIPALLKVAEIPAASRTLVDFVSGRREARTALQLFETVVLDPLIAFNLEAERASEEVLVRVGGSKSPSVESLVLDLPTRLRVLEKVAVYLLEQNTEDFPEGVLSTVLSEVLGPPLEVITSDLRAQTVFEFSGQRGGLNCLRFRKRAICTYFLARHIYHALTEPELRLHGLRYLGRYRFGADSGSDIAGIEVIDFIRAFIEEGSIEFNEGEFEFLESDDHDRARLDRHELAEGAEEFARGVKAYSVWTRYLPESLEKLGVHVTLSEAQKEWIHSPLREFSQDLVLVAGEGNLPPFMLGIHEVTNSEYADFLASRWVPALIEPATEEGLHIVEFVERDDAKVEGAHPLSWRGVHQFGARSEAASQPVASPMDFLALTNAYHLFQWPGGECPAALLSHPLVWPSFFVAAIYCNWLTLSEPQHAEKQTNGFYEIGVNPAGEPELTTREDSTGYRLPTREEWLYAARGGDKSRYPWESLMLSSNERLRDEGRRLKSSLLRANMDVQDVRMSRVNEYGITGLIGNVREWAFDAEAAQRGEGRIMGATWALGEDSFAYNYPGSRLAMVNTNLDVGFRTARNLDLDSVNKVEAATSMRMRKRSQEGK